MLDWMNFTETQWSNFSEDDWMGFLESPSLTHGALDFDLVSDLFWPVNDPKYF